MPYEPIKTAPIRTLSARWVIPVDSVPLENARITLIGDRIGSIERGSGASTDLNFGNAAIIPGLVNAHTHLDLTGLRGQAPPGADFTGWLRKVIAFRRSRAPVQVREDIRTGIAEALRYGTTLLGDISSDGTSRDLLADAPLRSIVYHEFLGLPVERARLACERLEQWARTADSTANCRIGVSPHAPYSVRVALFETAGKCGLPVATHVAESAEEMELLASHRGPFVQFLHDVGAWDPDGLVKDADAVIRLLSSASATLFVHCNFLPATTVIPPPASIVYCPRTHAAFGHPPHPFRAFLSRGVRVAVGTDSLASNPDLDVLAEIRCVHDKYPDVPGHVLLRMATLAGAEALGREDETGSLTAGKSADLVVVPLDAQDVSDPYRCLLESRRPVSAVFYRGQQVWPVDTAA
jgi:cytosine/adenosine deaminase-related metal-dependent hydrolase